MKIYAVLHHYDNGYTYEDYRYYTDTYLFETHKAASDYFWTKVTDDYEGSYELYEWELNTQNKVLIEESVWIKCSPDDEPFEEDWEEDCEEYYEQIDEEDWEKDCSYQEEFQIEEEWLTHEGENYKLFKEIEEVKLNSAFKELNNWLDTQLNYAQ